MTTIHRYNFETADGGELTTEFDSKDTAIEVARRDHLRVIEREYEFSDSSVVADFTDQPVSGFEDDPDLGPKGRSLR